MTVGPIEESFAMMNRYGLVYSSSDAERVDGLTYAWRKLHAQVSVAVWWSGMLFLALCAIGCSLPRSPF